MATATPNPTAIPIAKVSAHTEQQQTPRESPPISAPEAALIGSGITAVVAIVIFLLGQKFALDRDRESRKHADKNAREARKRDLLGTLRLWEQKFVVVRDPEKIASLYYGTAISEIASATEKFRTDVKEADREAFDRLNVISGMSPETMNIGSDRTQTICGAIRALIAFVQEA